MLKLFAIDGRRGAKDNAGSLGMLPPRRRPEVASMSLLRSFTLALLLLLLCAPLMLAQSNSIITDAHITFTTIDVPGAGVTNVFGINSAGDMVGSYGAAFNTPGHGFLFSGGNFTFFDYPGAYSTQAFGINDSGLISGTAFVLQNTAAVGFLYDGTSFTTIRAPGKSGTLPRGINNAGTVVGGDGATLSATKGFELIGTRFKTISPPGDFIYVFADGINNLGEIVGTDDNSSFFYRAGTFKTIGVAGASQTEAWGINDSRIIVGWYVTSACLPCGFALKNGKYISLSYPGGQATAALGISASGQIVGSYIDPSNVTHGFVTSPITAADFERYGRRQ